MKPSLFKFKTNRHHLVISECSQHTPGFNLKQIDYQPGQFDLYLEIDNLQALEHLKQRLSRLGFTAEIQSATSRSQVVESRLRITRSPR
ncbi:hypothetical protein THII_2741 [Thioploca ingrica]|uniref:Uncharacterized protein n=1 Tax=Thioploca ingrica TaxID=40754 RepID=A0A090AFV5_9GAMM|nr:hypothetical protein THII_2741 [Thioploca ingrica]